MKHKKATYKELANKFEVSKKTIERDINKLSFMGIPVYTQSGFNGGVFIDSKYNFDKTFFTNEDIDTFILSSYVLKCLNFKTDSNIWDKLGMLFPNRINLKEYELSEYFKIELLEKNINIKTEIYNTINNAFDLERKIIIEYENKKEKVCPIYYILRSSGLYLEISIKNERKTILFENIKSCNLSDEEFDREKILKNL